MQLRFRSLKLVQCSTRNNSALPIKENKSNVYQTARTTEQKLGREILPAIKDELVRYVDRNEVRADEEIIVHSPRTDRNLQLFRILPGAVRFKFAVRREFLEQPILLLPKRAHPFVKGFALRCGELFVQFFGGESWRDRMRGVGNLVERDTADVDMHCGRWLRSRKD